MYETRVVYETNQLAGIDVDSMLVGSDNGEGVGVDVVIV